MAKKTTYIKLLRKHSNYRGLRSMMTGLVVLCWLIAALVVTSFSDHLLIGGAIAIAGAIVLVVCAHVLRAVVLMLADGCDALVRLAEIRDLE